jgi:hypothetical protein
MALTTTEIIARCKAQAQQADDKGMTQMASTLYAAAHELERLNLLLARITAVYGAPPGSA